MRGINRRRPRWWIRTIQAARVLRVRTIRLPCWAIGESSLVETQFKSLNLSDQSESSISGMEPAAGAEARASGQTRARDPRALKSWTRPTAPPDRSRTKSTCRKKNSTCQPQSPTYYEDTWVKRSEETTKKDRKERRDFGRKIVDNEWKCVCEFKFYILSAGELRFPAEGPFIISVSQGWDLEAIYFTNSYSDLYTV